MLNLHCNKNGKKIVNKIKKIMRLPRFEPGIMGSKSTEVSTTQWRLMELTDKIINIC